MKRAIILIALILATAMALADVNYHVKVDQENGKLLFSITTKVKGAKTEFQIPTWAPGAYIRANYARNIKEVKAVGDKGAELKVDQPDNITWAVDTIGQKQVTLTYQTERTISQTGFQLNGPGSYMYLVGRKLERYTVEYELPIGWKIAVGLDPMGGNKFSATTYDVFIDSPAQFGNFGDDVFMVKGVPHHIITAGAGAGTVDRKKLTEICQKIAEAETSLYRHIPYKRYFFFFTVFNGLDGGGGLEHLNSTSISLASGLGPRAAHVIAHEFFHLWNVKRIRPFVLGPFDYTQPAITKNLWFSEGVTDYYARVIHLRSGLYDQNAFLKDLSGTIQELQSNPARLTVTADASSERVWEANNSQGFGRLSYYTKGDLVGVCLDLKLRELSNGKKSLDDVMRYMYDKCGRGNGPGFQEDGIREAVIKFGGAEMGPLYDRLARSTDEMPFTELLAGAGVRCMIKETQQADIGGTLRSDADAKGLIVGRIRPDSPMDAAGLNRGDTIIEVDGKPIVADGGDASKDLQAALTKMNGELQPDVPIKVAFMRDGKREEATITPKARKVMSTECTFADSPTAGQKHILEGWLSGKN